MEKASLNSKIFKLSGLVWNRVQESEDFGLRKGIIAHIWDIEQWYEEL